MRSLCTALMLCVFACGVIADVAHIKASKAKLIGHLVGKGKHNKRGILSHLPPYKLGHDIPLVTHSLVKPLVVTYPPTAAVATVKVPLTNPLVPRFPVGVGHKVPGLPHPHYALRFPHTKYYVKPDHHFHHHHHHVEPKPVVPVAPLRPVVDAAPVAPVVPLPHPTAAIAHALPTPVLSPQPVPIAPPPVVIPQSHVTPIPLAPALLPRPLYPLQQQYVFRPGGSIHASYFATYPRYPLISSYQAPIYPLHSAPAVPAVQSVQHVIQAHSPPFHVLPQVVPHEGVEQNTHNVIYEQTPATLHPGHEVPQPAIHVHTPTQHSFSHPTFTVQPTLIPQPTVHLEPTQPSVPVEHDGWSPVQPHPADGANHHFVQEQGTQVYEHHQEQHFNDFQHQIQQHIQQQIEQAQYEQNLQNQHHLQQEYGAPQIPYEYHGQTNPYQGQDIAHHAHDFAQSGHDFSQHGPDFSQQGQDFSHQSHDFSQQGNDYSLPGQDFGQSTHPNQEYGVPQPEGRSLDDDSQQFHNHIPLALQPPIDRPLDHFQ
ncbi:unnamed protein product [Leptosia nina]|uniref:Uncharacterized protein n=1 Tax=Leptosia nina TaxID=320188 RepID=A0AAV1J346_9NEOP